MRTATIINETILKEIHFEMLEWKSELQFIEEEIQFINQLLNSHVFEWNTPNLFERLQELRQQIMTIGDDIRKITSRIVNQESELGQIMEYDTLPYDIFYTRKHMPLKGKINKLYKRYREYKSEMFNYTLGVLKKQNI